MTIADDIKVLARSIRAIPGQFGLRPHRVYLVTAEWTGIYSGDGQRVEDEVEITESDNQPPKVRWLTDDEIAVGNGAISNGTIEIGPITSEFSGGGITMAELRASTIDAGGTVVLRIVGTKYPEGAFYRLTEVRADRVIHWKLRAAPITAQVE